MTADVTGLGRGQQPLTETQEARLNELLRKDTLSQWESGELRALSLNDPDMNRRMLTDDKLGPPKQAGQQ